MTIIKYGKDQYFLILKSSNLVVDTTTVAINFGFYSTAYKHNIIGSSILSCFNCLGKFKTYKDYFKYVDKN